MKGHPFVFIYFFYQFTVLYETMPNKVPVITCRHVNQTFPHQALVKAAHLNNSMLF